MLPTTRSTMVSVALSSASPVGLERVAAARSILEAIRVSPLAVAEATSTVDSASAARSAVRHVMTVIRDAADVVTGIAAVHALAAIPGAEADRALADVLRSGPGPLPTHAAWASAGRAPARELLEPLVDVLIAGHLAGMHAQGVLAQWARLEPSRSPQALRTALIRTNDGDGRRPVIETLGLVPDDGVLPDLASVAADRSESDLVRVAAVAALGDRLRSPMPRSIAALASADDRVADAVRLAEADRASRRLEVVGRRSSQRVGMNVAARGVRVAQIHLGAVLDPDLLHSGVGDTGGVATLLVRLGPRSPAFPISRRSSRSAAARYVMSLTRRISRWAAPDSHLWHSNPRQGRRSATPGRPGSRRSAAWSASSGSTGGRMSSTCGWPTSAAWPQQMWPPGWGSPPSSVSRRPARPDLQPRRCQATPPQELRCGRRPTPSMVSRPPRRAPCAGGRPCGALSP